MERAILYARISVDKRGEETGVQRQLKDMRELATRNGWQVVDEIAENDVSAYANRPGFEKVWQMVRGGAVDLVVCWHTSRLVRSRSDRAAVISEFGKHSVGIVAVKGPSLDLRSAYGRGLADLMTAIDSMESEIKAERISASIEDLACRGRSWGVCPFGWLRVDGEQVVNEDQAAIVREIVDRLLGGQSIREIAADLNDRAVPTPGAKQWINSTVRTLAKRPSNIGVRVHKGTSLPGDWPAIVDEGKHHRVTALLAKAERRTHSGPRPGARKYLLTSGIGCCGKCGAVLRTIKRSYGRLYACAPHDCTARQLEPVDELVRQKVIERLSQPDALEIFIGDDDAAQRAADLVEQFQQRIDAASNSYAEGNISLRQLEVITERLTPDLEAAREARDVIVRSLNLEAMKELAGPTAAKAWDLMTVSQRRTVLEVLRVEVTLLPRQLHGPGFEGDTVRVRFRNPAD